MKRITVKPGEGLSVQMHHHRAEHWVVVAGTAKVTIDGEVKLLGENESIYIPLGATHCLENPGKIPLDLIEVRSGSYLEEDDIIRFRGSLRARVALFIMPGGAALSGPTNDKNKFGHYMVRANCCLKKGSSWKN